MECRIPDSLEHCPGKVGSAPPASWSSDFYILPIRRTTTKCGIVCIPWRFINQSGITEEKHTMRVKAAQRRLMQLSPIGIHIHGFNTNLCVMLYRLFFRSVYEYGPHLVPLSLALKLVNGRLESCFFRLVLGKLASRFGSSRLPRLRSLCRLESLDFRRIIMGHQRLSYYHGRNPQLCKYRKLTLIACKTCDRPANNSPCLSPTLA